MLRYLSIVLTLFLLTTAVLAQPLMSVRTEFGPSFHHELTVHTKHGELHLKLDLNVPAKIEKNRLVLHTPHGEVNLVLPERAVERMMYHLRHQFRHVPPEVNAMLEQNLHLKQCEVLDQNTYEYRKTYCYEAKLPARGKLLGLFDVTVDVTVQCTADTLTCEVRRPWWSFLVFGWRLA